MHYVQRLNELVMLLVIPIRHTNQFLSNNLFDSTNRNRKRVAILI